MEESEIFWKFCFVLEIIQPKTFLSWERAWQLEQFSWLDTFLWLLIICQEQFEDIPRIEIENSFVTGTKTEHYRRKTVNDFQFPSFDFLPTKKISFIESVYLVMKLCMKIKFGISQTQCVWLRRNRTISNHLRKWKTEFKLCCTICLKK